MFIDGNADVTSTGVITTRQLGVKLGVGEGECRLTIKPKKPIEAGNSLLSCNVIIFMAECWVEATALTVASSMRMAAIRLLSEVAVKDVLHNPEH